MGEFGFAGKAPGTYNMYLGGVVVGERLNTLEAVSATEEQGFTVEVGGGLGSTHNSSEH